MSFLQDDNDDVVIKGDDGSAEGVKITAIDDSGTKRLAGDSKVTSSVLPDGASTSANQSTTHTRIGTLTETAPATDTASSGLNGRLQRIAQRITSTITTLTDGSQQSKLRGNTDGTLIGNSGDAIKTVASPVDAGDFTTFKSNIEVILASDILYTTLHTVIGAGLLIGATFVVDSDEVECRIRVDGSTVFEFTGSFLEQVVNKDSDFKASGLFSVSNDKKRLYFTPPTPFRYTSSLDFDARKAGKKVKYQLYTYSVE